MTTFETSVWIKRPIEEVFVHVADPLGFPEWNSAVQSVWKIHGHDGEAGSTYTMLRELRGGRVDNELEVVASEPPVEFAIRTMSGPTPFLYRYRFSAENGETVVRLSGAFDLGGAAALLGPLAGRAVKRGVDDNLAALKRTLETSVRPVQGHR